MGYFKPRTGDREVGGAALSWQELLVVIMSAENQHVLGTPHLIGAFCGEVSVGCVGAIRGGSYRGGPQGTERLSKQLLQPHPAHRHRDAGRCLGQVTDFTLRRRTRGG